MQTAAVLPTKDLFLRHRYVTLPTLSDHHLPFGCDTVTRRTYCTCLCPQVTVTPSPASCSSLRLSGRFNQLCRILHSATASSTPLSLTCSAILRRLSAHKDILAPVNLFSTIDRMAARSADKPMPSGSVLDRSALRTRTRQPLSRVGVCQTHQALNLKVLYSMRRRWLNRQTAQARPSQASATSAISTPQEHHAASDRSRSPRGQSTVLVPPPMSTATSDRSVPGRLCSGSSETASVPSCIRLQLILKTSESFP